MSFTVTCAKLKDEYDSLIPYRVSLLEEIKILGDILIELYPTFDKITQFVTKLGHTTLVNAVSTAGGPFTEFPNYFCRPDRFRNFSVQYDYKTATFTPTVSTIVVTFLYPTNRGGGNMYPNFSNRLDYTTMYGTTTASNSRYYPLASASSSSNNIYRRVGGQVTHPPIVSGPFGANATLSQTYYYPFQVKFGIKNTTLYDRTVVIPVPSVSATYFNDFITYVYKFGQDCIPMYTGIWEQYTGALRQLYFTELRLTQVSRMILSLSATELPPVLP